MSKYISNKWKEIRSHYAKHNHEIMSEKAHVFAIDPYAWDMGKAMIWMTPIETAMWCDIRNQGLVMYPQWPQCGFFLDFANPVAKVAIECDGKEFHDEVLDRKRDAILENDGWTIYRIKGFQCLKDGFENEDGKYEYSYSEKLCIEIAEKHKISARFVCMS